MLTACTCKHGTDANKRHDANWVVIRKMDQLFTQPTEVSIDLT